MYGQFQLQNSNTRLASQLRCRRAAHCLLLSLAVGLLLPDSGFADVIELLSGAKVRGDVVERTATYVTLRVVVGKRKITRKYPVEKIHAVTVGSKRDVVNKKGGGVKSSIGQRRSRGEVKSLIERVGQTPPDWYDSVPLNYPRTIDLSWPKAKGPWNTQKNVGQFLWSSVNENPRRWKEGTKFMHHVLSVNRGKSDVQQKAFGALGHCYHDLLGDWARAAYWWQKLGKYQMTNFVGLADCYWKLGSKEMAADMLRRVSTDRSRYGSAIKLWSDMGDLDKALQLARSSAQAGNPSGAYVAAGDACRKQGRFSQAIGYYNKVLAVREGPKKNDILKRNKSRAKIAIDNITVFETFDAKRIPDGQYAASSLAYIGNLSVAVTVQNGRIATVRITKHSDKQYYSALTDTPKQIIIKQGFKDVDATTGATITSEAIINATAKALAGAEK